MSQIGPANFIIGNSAQCFKKKKNQKDISEIAREISKGLELISSRQESLTSFGVWKIL